MKAATINTNTHEIMLVELPQGTFLTADENHYGCKPIDGDTFTPISNLDWKFIGRILDLRESDVEPFVEKVMQGHHFQNYKLRQNNNLPDWSSFLWVKTALESFLSLLETEIHLENPYESYRACTPEHFKQWEQLYKDAQSRTFDKARTIVLVKENK